MSKPLPIRIKLIAWLERCEIERPEAASLIVPQIGGEQELNAAIKDGDVRLCRNIRDAYRPTEQGLRKMAEYIEREAA